KGWPEIFLGPIEIAVCPPICLEDMQQQPHGVARRIPTDPGRRRPANHTVRSSSGDSVSRLAEVGSWKSSAPNQDASGRVSHSPDDRPPPLERKFPESPR